ncbi:MAG TPA: 30S ribosomal protein S6, partial [Desulfurobacteriaceae bacterium]|nr:30S ribosomal protein S6 [Desulfurobacteriaceae bacterium]
MREYFYEVAYILKPSLSQNEVEEEIKKINERIEKYGGKIIDIEKWGKRKLAYKIEKIPKKTGQTKKPKSQNLLLRLEKYKEE